MSGISPIDNQIASMQMMQSQLKPVEVNSEMISPAAQVGSTADLEKNYPQIFEAIKMGIANDIIKQMQHHTERIREAMKKSRENQ